MVKDKFISQGVIEVVISIEGMICADCREKVENIVKKLDGILDVRADCRKGEVCVKAEKGKVTIDDLMATINQSGYKTAISQVKII